MSKQRKILIYIMFPFVTVGLIMILITAIFGFILEKFSENTSFLLALISVILIVLGVIIYFSFLPLVKKKEKINYAKEVSTDFSDIMPLDFQKHYVLLGFEVIVKVQDKGLFFPQMKQLIPYSDMEIEIEHRDFYGHIENYFKIKINQKKYKKYPKSCYLMFNRNLLAVFKEYHVQLLGLEKLDPNYQTPKVTKKYLKKYTYPLRFLFIKIGVTLALITAVILLSINQVGGPYIYLGILPICLIWMHTSRSGSLYIYDDMVMLKRNMIKTYIKYEDILNVDIKDKHLYVVSTLDYLQFDANPEIVEEIKKYL